MLRARRAAKPPNVLALASRQGEIRITGLAGDA
jgi:hypothetical protein